MKESNFGFEYSWEDLAPIRAMVVVVLVAQAVGAVAGCVVAPFPKTFNHLWFGAAIAMTPGLLLGALLQARLKPGGNNRGQIPMGTIGVRFQ